MKRLTFVLLLTISGLAWPGEKFGGYGSILEKINVDASYSATQGKAIKTLEGIPPQHIKEFSRHAYERYLKSQSESDYTGILDIIPPKMLSDVVETVMLSRSYGYDFLNHEFYFTRTPGIAFNNKTAVFQKVTKHVKDECEREVWNALFIAKGVEGTYRFKTSCKLIGQVVSGKTTFTKAQLLDVYYKFRDIDGY